VASRPIPGAIDARLTFNRTKIGRDPAGPPDAQCAAKKRRRRAMAIDMKEPAVKAPWPPKEENGEGPRARASSPSRGSTRSAPATSSTTTSRPRILEINWYLANYIGCPAPKHGQRYFEFAGAPYDPVKNTGVIFIPTHGETTSNALNRFGEKIVENYNNTTNKEPGGLCYETCYNRVKLAARAVGVTIPAWSNGSTFSIIWGTLIAQKG
jgi:hypothetical protein